MRVIFKVRTPKGQASKTNDKIKKLIIGFNKVQATTYINDDDNEIIWEVTGGIKQIFNIQKNVARFDIIMKNIFENKMMKKFGASQLKKDELEELEDMLRNQTTVEIIKEATLQEVNEYNETVLDKVKKSWKKFNPFS